nr:reverse transcriptase domain-containing protein [Tanacetum cinerariifolium]
MMSISVFASPESSTQAYLVGTDTESEPFEDPEFKTPKSPHIVAPPTCHVEESEGSGTPDARSTSSDSTVPLSPDHPLTHSTPVLVPILCRTARIAVCVPPVMSHGLSAGIAEVAGMPDSSFRKRFRSSYDSSPSLTLPVQKRYRGTSELILGTDSEEIDESLDSGSESEDAKDEGPTAEDDDPATGDEGLAAGVEGPGVDDESYGLDEESHGVDDESRVWKGYKILNDRCPNHNMLPVSQIDTFYNGISLRHRDTINAAAGGTFMKRRPEEYYDLIEYMTAHHHDWDTPVQKSESSSSITSSFDLKIVALKAEMAEINKNLMKVLQVKAVTPSCETCSGPHSYNDCPATVGQTQNVYTAGAYNQGGNSYQPQVGTTTEFTNYMKENDAILKNMQTNMTSLENSYLELKNMFGQFMKMNTASSLSLGTLPSNTITNSKEDLKGITIRSGIAYKGPTIPTTSSPPKVVEREIEMTKDTVPHTNNGSSKDVQPLVVQAETKIPNSNPVVAPVVELVEAPVSAPKPNPKPLILYPSRLHDQKLREKANDKMEKFFQIFHDLNFNISFVNALILMPKFASTIKSLLTNKEKLFELSRTPLNKHCLVVLHKKLPETLRDPGKFLIPCDFLGMDECLALADLGTSINLMPLSC